MTAQARFEQVGAQRAGNGFGQRCRFLARCRPSVIEKGYRKVAFTAEFGDPWFTRMAGVQGLADLARNCRIMASEAAARNPELFSAGATMGSSRSRENVTPVPLPPSPSSPWQRAQFSL